MIKKYAILGGSFNPVHNGHLEMARCSKEQFGLDEIIFMPNKTTYYKETKVLASDEHRLNMLRLATKPYSYMSVSDMEIKRGGVTHTIDTIREFHNESSDDRVNFIIGGDSLQWLDKWVEAQELLRLTTFIAAIRDDVDTESAKGIIAQIKDEYPDSDIRLLNMKSMSVSSSDIRSRIKTGDSIEGLVPEYVEKYIYDNKCYS